ncbi:MAG: hypothetical protein HY301_05525 [Verrucomicrobia bacterium]|nr:hypothetical protein [Verrucomicrobiota bacterium]
MDTVENKPVPGAAANDSVQQEVNTLRHILNAALVLLIIATGSVNLFVYKQVAGLGRQVDISEAQVRGAAGEFEQNFKPVANVLLQNLYVYAQRDLAFAQVLAKHQVAPAPAPAAAPAKPVAPPKK